MNARELVARHAGLALVASLVTACSSPEGTTGGTSSSGGGGLPDGGSTTISSTSSTSTGGTGGAGGSGGVGGSGTGATGQGAGGAGGAPPVCGNGVAEAGEACDGADLAGQSCAAQGFVGGTIQCTAQCTLDTSHCHHCGDGAVDPGEDCDGAALGGASCTSLGFDLGTLGCTSSCAYDTSACAFFTCGDGMVNAAEQCDGADLAGASCADLGFDGGNLACAGNCVLDTSACFKCGDGTKNGAEACDGADFGGAMCASLGFDGGVLSCTSGCAIDTSACFKCGDGTKNGAEACDGADLGGATCASLGFATGTLACSPTCALDTSQCLTACALDAAPVVTLPATFVAGAYAPFALHATITDDDPIGALTITWSGPAGAPPLTGATTPDPSGVTADCGAYSYTVTVTDPCGKSASASIQVTVPGNGPYVSASTCDPLHECGSTAHPWCTIQKGINQTSGTTVMVAGQQGAYVESVLMHDGIDVLGGYEPSFTLPRNPDPATNQTTVQSTGSAFTWGAGATATLDGFRIVPTMPTSSASARAVLQLAGSAHATLTGVSIDPSVGTPRYSTEYAVLVGAGTGGSLDVHTSTLRSPKATSTTYALSIDPAADLAVTIDQSSLLAVNPSSGSVSIGLDQRGVGAISMQGGTITAGVAQSTYGLRASPTTITAPRQITLNGVDVVGSTGTIAYGIRVDGAALLQIQGGSVRAHGSNNTMTTAVGVYADSVGQFSLNGATVEGTDATYNLGESVSAYGVQISNTKNVAGASATIVNSNVLGGTLGFLRRGVLSQGVPLDVQGSTIAGTRTPAVYGNLRGPYGTTGVELAGTFPPGTVVHFLGNVEILGGDCQNPCFNYQCGGAGILFNAAIDSVIDQNQEIRGAYAASGFGMDGIRINAGGTHLVTGNTSIEAGSDVSGNGSYTAGVNVVSAGAVVANVTLQQNTLIAGNTSSTSGGGLACGFHGAGVNATIVDNARILGGYGYNPMGVSIERAGASGVVNSVTIRGNTIDGGTQSATGVKAVYTTGTITDNLVHACGLSQPDGQPVAKCLQAGTSQGLVLEGDQGTLVANNYVFGGYTSSTTACRVGCYSYNGGPGCVSGTKTTFLANLCAARSTSYTNGTLSATALLLGNPTAGDCPLFADNILDASGTVGTVRSFEHFDPVSNSAPTECYQFFANDLVPRGLTCAAYVNFTGKVCYANAAELNLKGNTVQQIAGDVSVTPGYVAEDYTTQTSAGYHLDATCSLGGLGLPYSTVTTDYDGNPRDPAHPAVGPDECP